MFGFSDCRLIRACGVRDAGEVAERQELISAVESLARELCGGP
jgi:hypothetical protein